MNRYDEYRDSGIEWIGEIPSTWNLVRGRMVFYPKKELNRNLQCQNLLSLTLSGVLNKDVESSEGLRPETYSSYQIFQKKDLVFKMIDLENVKTSRVGIVHEIGIMSPVYLRHEPLLDKIDPKFAYWFYYDLYKKEIYNSIGSGVRSSLSSGNLLELELPLPPLEEQKLIASYLDKKTEQIDRLVGKIQKKIDLLKEQRAALINHCVTKGLNPNVEMKDSGIEWIGEIPKHWELGKVKYLSNLITKGTTPSNIGEDFDENGRVRFIKGEDLFDGYIIPTGSSHISEDVDEKLKRSQLKVGDLLIVIAGTLGKCAVVTAEILPANTNQAISLIRMKDWVNTNYVRFWFETSSCKNQISKFSVVAVQPNLSMEDLGNIIIPIISEKEQNSIEKFVRVKVDNFDLKLEKERKRLELLSEYRQSLISSVVTGKVRVTEDMI